MLPDLVTSGAVRDSQGVLMHLQVRGASCHEDIVPEALRNYVLMHLQVRGASCQPPRLSLLWTLTKS